MYERGENIQYQVYEMKYRISWHAPSKINIFNNNNINNNLKSHGKEMKYNIRYIYIYIYIYIYKCIT